METANMLARLLPSKMASMVESKRSSSFSAVAAERLPDSAADSMRRRLHSENALSLAENSAERASRSRNATMYPVISPRPLPCPRRARAAHGR